MSNATRIRGTCGSWAAPSGPQALALLLILGAGAGLVALSLSIDPGPGAGVAPAARPSAEPLALSPQGVSDASRVTARALVPGRSASPADEPPPDPASAGANPAGSRTEREFLAELLELARQDPQAFSARAETVLSGEGPACEQVALLRAAYALARPDVPRFFARAVASLPATSSPHGESVPVTALLWLSERAPREPLARAALAEIAWAGDRPAAAGFRAQALRHLVHATPSGEREALRARILGLHERDLLEVGLEALEGLDRPSAAPPQAEHLPE